MRPELTGTALFQAVQEHRPAAGCHSPFGSWKPASCGRVSDDTEAVRLPGFDVPQEKLLRQSADGELVGKSEDGVCSPRNFAHGRKRKAPYANASRFFTTGRGGTLASDIFFMLCLQRTSDRLKLPPVISLLLSNLFLHYTFGRWMEKHHPTIPFERFADDIPCHCDSEQQAQELKEMLEKRFAECGLELHPSKTRIVYCKDDDRRDVIPTRNSISWALHFAPDGRRIDGGKFFVNFCPGVSNVAMKAIRRRIRSWQFRCRTDKWINDLARMFNPVIQGWMNYYGRYYKSVLYPTLRYLDRCMALWAIAKCKRLRRHRRRAAHWVHEVVSRDPTLFAHWEMLHRAMAGR